MSGGLREIARETVEIVERGGYGKVDLRERVAAAVAGTRMYAPSERLEPPLGPAVEPTVEVTGESTLAATSRLGGQVAALVFASARHPGGGFRTGAQAQEESLARSSALYRCLVAAEPFYTYHRSHPDTAYSDRVIFSPAVPVFRDDRGELLATPYPVSFLTAAAPNRGAMNKGRDDIPRLLTRRAARVLAVAAAHGQRRLVLGAWGCGVFRNDPAVAAEAFRAALAVRPWFDHITFAVLDRSAAAPTRSAFIRVFG